MLTNKYNAQGERYSGPPRQMNLELLRRNKFTRLILRWFHQCTGAEIML